MKNKKVIAMFMAVTLLTGTFTGCSSAADASAATGTKTAEASPTTEAKPAQSADTAETQAKTKAPKYVFLFIGDGMSYPQFQAASDYLGALEDADDIVSGGKNLSFMDFETAGTATTFDSTSFCPDSASTATSISTGYKTHSGVINMDETKSKSYETISEKLKEQKDYKVGIISSVNLNHATPAAFYAHQASRNSYYDIGKEMVESGFDYFAGGGLKDETGENKDQTGIYTVAEEAGYKVLKTQAEAEALKAEDGKAIIIGETLADSDALSYDNDRAEKEWSLADYVDKGIEVLDNDNGFFMMVEGGKIDWACHANDAGSTVADTVALGDAVTEAVEFAAEHKDETLILVTGDHETGGLTIGYAGTDYDTFLTNLENQQISYAKYDSDYVAKYKENKTGFEEAMKDVESLFGLVTPENAGKAKDETLVLNDYEMQRLKEAYELTLAGGIGDEASQEEYVKYGTYEPFSVTVTHLLNNKSGINFASYAHTGLPVAVFAEGAGAEAFGGTYDNTDIYKKMAELLGVE